MAGTQREEWSVAYGNTEEMCNVGENARSVAFYPVEAKGAI